MSRLGIFVSAIAATLPLSRSGRVVVPRDLPFSRRLFSRSFARGARAGWQGYGTRGWSER